MRRRLLIALAVVNVFLGLALMAKAADSQVLMMGFRDCCKGGDTEAYCCDGCCWAIENCARDSDCGQVERAIKG